MTCAHAAAAKSSKIAAAIKNHLKGYVVYRANMKHAKKTGKEDFIPFAGF